MPVLPEKFRSPPFFKRSVSLDLPDLLRTAAAKIIVACEFTVVT
jgi:hypothetical protein